MAVIKSGVGKTITAGTAVTARRACSVTRIAIRWRYRSRVSAWKAGVAPRRSVKAGCANYSDRVCVGWRTISSKKQCERRYTCRALRDLIIARCGIDCGIENVQQAAERACEKSRFDPVLDYLDSRRWDGQPRLDRWMITYLGAEDTPLNRSIGRKMLIAAARRARHPGCKFDYVVVLEGKQGTGKSRALRILAGEENFSDQPLLHLEPRAQQEAIEGTASKRLRPIMNRRGWQGPKKLRFDKDVLGEGAKKQKKVSVTKQGYWRPPPGDCSG
jgi:hypothetical protein